MDFIPGLRFIQKPLFVIFIVLNSFQGVLWTHSHMVLARYENLYSPRYILLWTSANENAPMFHLPIGQEGFHDCPISNCFIIRDSNFFGGSLQNFDAIAFNGYDIDTLSRSSLPSSRYPHQHYIYASWESADKSPVCNQIYDNFFNWTITYRLDSDSPFLYFIVRDLAGEIIGPLQDMRWEKDYFNFSMEVRKRPKAAAWFVSNCRTRSNRMRFVKKLQQAMDKYDMKIDIYGKCGSYKCPKSKHSECVGLLKNYYFYLSLENSFAEDYVTEKVLHALQNGVVPIVYGGANYSRFLPPGSYINALELTPKQLASKMYRLIQYPYLYRQYFRWTSYYTYQMPIHENVCDICATLEEKIITGEHSVYKQFRSWWNPNYKSRCAEKYS